MPVSTALPARQGLAYLVAAHGVLQRQSKSTKCPEAQLLTLLALHTMQDEYPAASTKQLHEVMQISLPLLRGYVRELTARGYVERVRFYRRGARLLQLTKEGKSVAHVCQRELRGSASRVLEWRAHQ